MVKNTRKKVQKNKDLTFIILSVIVILTLLVFLSSLLIISQYNKKETTEIKETFFTSGDFTRVYMSLPAVDQEGRGANTKLKVEISPGTGRTLTDIDNLLFWADTQHSIRIAKQVAENLTGKNTGGFDIVYTIEANASLIGGPSAGAALAIATVAALEGKKPNENVMITGTINHDGTIGPVGGIVEKAKASKDVGAELFLVPLAQSREVVYKMEQHCESYGHTKICTTETLPVKFDVEEETGISVREVGSITDAKKYFFE